MTNITANTPLTMSEWRSPATGFTIVELETEALWLRSNHAIIELLKEVNLPAENRGDNKFALARKTGAPTRALP